MSHELHYTSVPRGLQPGSRGFCTVAHTQGLAAPLMQKLEGLSGYRPIFPPLDERAHLNPVAWSHLHVNVMGTTYSVLSRVCPAGLDYSERTNKFAHHVALDPSETAAGGPAWTMEQPGFIDTAWQGEPRLLPRGRTPPRGDVKHGVARAWQQLAGDAGWAGVLAEATLADPNRPIYIVTDLGVDVLSLFAEALALLPPEKRWAVTFSTYFATVPAGQPCLWRWVQKDSPEAKAAARQSNAMEIDLTSSLGQAKGGALVECARTGQAPPRVAAPSSTPSTHQRPGPSRSTITPPRADYASEPTGRSSSTRAEESPTAAIVPEARMGLDPWEKKSKRAKEPLAEPAPAASWPTFVGAFIGLLIVAGGAYVVYLIMTADKAATPDDILKMVSTTPRETKPTVIAKATEPIKPPVKVIEEPMTTVEVPKPPMPVAKVEEPVKPVKVEPPKRERETYVKRHFALPGRSSDAPRDELLKDVGKVVALQLFGLEEVADKIPKSKRQLKQTHNEGNQSLKITIEGASGEPTALALFQMHKDGKLSFRWYSKANSDDEGRAASSLVRDCVLEVKNDLGEVTYFSFREPLHIPALKFTPPVASIEGTQFPFESFPIALPNSPIRDLNLDIDLKSKPSIRDRAGDVTVQGWHPHPDGFEIRIDKGGTNARACEGAAALYSYEQFVIGPHVAGKVPGAPPAAYGVMTLKVEPQNKIKNMKELQEADRQIGEDAKSRDLERPPEAAKEVNLETEKEKDPKKKAVMLSQTAGRIDARINAKAREDAVGFENRRKEIASARAKWLKDDKELRDKVKPTVTIPAGVIWMKVGDLRVDIYQIH